MVKPRLRLAVAVTIALVPACGGQPGVASRSPVGDEPPAPSPVAIASSPPSATTIAAAPPAPRLPSEIEGRVESWMRTIRTHTACEAFDYFPNGGMQNLWCHRPEDVTLASLRALAKTDIFLSGPHGADALTFDARASFGHYNPAFVRWLVSDLAPSARGSLVQQMAQRRYDTALRPLAEVLWKTHVKLDREKDCFAREKKAYEDGIAKKTLAKGYYERWFFFMNPYYCERSARAVRGDDFYYDNGFDAGVSGNVAKSAVGFWLRRAMDGTRETFVEGLKKVVATYQPDLLEGTRAPDGAAITKALDAAALAARACKSGLGPVAHLSVDVTVTAAGKANAQVSGTNARGIEAASCVEAHFAAVSVPAWDGADLKFRRVIALK